MQKIANYNGKLISLVMLEEQLASKKGIQVWECSCGSTFMTVFYASFHCEKHHHGEKFEDRIKLKKGFPTETKLWQSFYTEVTEVLLNTYSSEVPYLSNIEGDENQLADEIVVVEQKVRKREATDQLNESVIDIKRSKTCNADTSEDDSQPSTQQEIGTDSNDTVQNCENGGCAETAAMVSENEKENKNDDTSYGYPLPFNPRLSEKTPMISRTGLKCQVPDPNFYPYPDFTLAYHHKLLFHKDGTTPNKFYWNLMAEYYQDVQARNLNPVVARNLWMQRHAPDYLLNGDFQAEARVWPSFNTSEPNIYVETSSNEKAHQTISNKIAENKLPEETDVVEQKVAKIKAVDEISKHVTEPEPNKIYINEINEEDAQPGMHVEMEIITDEFATSDERSHDGESNACAPETDKENNLDDDAQSYPLQFSKQSSKRTPMITIPELKCQIPDPASYPYPDFTLAYHHKLLFHNDGTTPNKFYWNLMAEYYQDVNARNINPWTARNQWMQRHAPEYLINNDDQTEIRVWPSFCCLEPTEVLKPISPKVHEMSNKDIIEAKQSYEKDVVERKTYKREVVPHLVENVIETNLDKESDCNTSRDVSQPIIHVEVEAGNIESETSDENGRDRENDVFLPESEKENNIYNVSHGYPQFSCQLSEKAPMITRPELRIQIPDPNFYPYPEFALAYHHKLLFHKDGTTPNKFYWNLMAEYYQDVHARNLNPWHARSQWMQRHAPNSQINY